MLEVKRSLNVNQPTAGSPSNRVAAVAVPPRKPSTECRPREEPPTRTALFTVHTVSTSPLYENK